MIDKNSKLITLKDKPFIEIYKIEEIDDSIFKNYQRYDFHQLLWFTKVEGHKTYFIDFNEYEIKENDIIFLYPGQIDRLDSSGIEGYLIAIESNILFEINQRLSSDYLNGYFSNILLPADDATQEKLKIITKLLLDEYHSQKRLILLVIYTEAFLFYIISLFDNLNEYKDYSKTIVARLMQLIDKHYIEQREISFYAGQLNISQKQLNFVSKKGTGRTVKQHLQERLMLEIKKEIRIGEKSLKEIAFDLGFNDPAYFTRLFKIHTGISPSEFKYTS